MRTQWTKSSENPMYHMECPINPHFSEDMEHLVQRISGENDCKFKQFIADSLSKVVHISLTDFGKGKQKWIGVWGNDLKCVMETLIAVCKEADQLLGDNMTIPSMFLPTLAISNQKGWEHSGYSNHNQVWTWEKRATSWSARGVVQLCQ